MSGEPGGQNHYQVLGLERGADERAVKKAYFALIRKSPPDTHPEEFKRLREAYEVLADPVARQRFDGAERDYREYGDDAAVALREAEAAVKAGDESTAQQRLRALVAGQPHLRIARENLASSLSRTKTFAEALTHLDALLEQAPEEARYHLYRGLVLRGLERPKKAVSAVREAHRLAPEDLGIHVALIDLLAHEKAWDEALAEVEEAVERQKAGTPGALRMALRRIDLLFNAQDRAGAEEAITELVAEVSSAGDAELRKHVCSQLGAIAAGCFVRKDRAGANAVLRRCEEIEPANAVLHPFPAKVVFDLVALPLPAQQWLAQLEPGGPTVSRPVWGMTVIAFLVILAFTCFAFILLLDDPGAWGAAGIVAAGMFSACGVTGLSLSARRIAGILASPLRGRLTVHPLYLIDMNADRVSVYPLLGLTNLQAVHHHTNRRYTHTQVTVWFGDETVGVALRGRPYAEGWVGGLIGYRNRALELMLEGYLEAERGVDLIPPALLTRVPEAPATSPRSRASLRWYAATAAAALALWGSTVFANARAADERQWRDAVRADTLGAYQTYATAAPSGRHVAAAREAALRLHQRAEADLRAAADATGAPVLRSVLAALQAGGVTRMPLVFDLGGTVKTGEEARVIATDLNAVLAAAGLEQVMGVEPSSAPGAPATLFFTIDLGGQEPRSAIELACKARLVIAGSPAPPWAWSTTVARRDAGFPVLDTSPGSGVDPTLASRAMIELCAWRLGGALGLGGVAAARRNAAPFRAAPSPYPTRKL